MNTVEKTKQMENRYQQAVTKYNEIVVSIEEKAAENKSIQDETEILRFEYDELERKKQEADNQLKSAEDMLREKQTELQLIEKDIQIAKLNQKTEEERAETDLKFEAIMEKYLECDPFFIEFLKRLGKRVTKRNEKGEIVETQSIYDIYLEARERRRKRVMADGMRTRRRLPDISGVVDANGGGIETGGKHPTVDDGMSL